MRCQFQHIGLTGVRVCHNAFAVRPRVLPKVSPPIITWRSAAVGSAKPRRAREAEDEGEDDRPWELGNLTSLAHGELEQHREVRHYARIAAYEMPRLAELATPFIPPTKVQPLRFRYTTYMGEDHPAESKVVVEFGIADLGLTVPDIHKFIKLAGPRYNPQKKVVKMSCEMFDHQAQNKRYLSDLIEKLLEEAKDHTDPFEDIPNDFRHHKFKRPNRRIPLSWLRESKQRHEARTLKSKPAVEPSEDAVISEKTLYDG